LSAASITSGTLGVANGGTGATNLTANGILMGNDTGSVSAITPLTDGQVLIGRTGSTPIPATLTAGTGVTITTGNGTITIAGSGASSGSTFNGSLTFSGVTTDITTATNENCPAPDANQTTYRSPSPTKAGNMVYISSRIKQVVCVKDGTGKLEKRALDVNGSHSFFGKAPFVLMTTNLSQADIFFQGYRVRIDDPNASSVILEEVPY
ncbi:MAG: hypothetical protein EBV00_06575, partial [Burkholderiaceae bacterium]|nr:hypothetical protein [Burkholderiaceae bacterium]